MRIAPASSPLIPHPGFPAHAPLAFPQSRFAPSQAGQACLQVEDIHQALKFATRPTDVGWHGYAGAVGEDRVVGRLRDLVELPQQAGLDAKVTGHPFGPYTGPRAGSKRITIVESHRRYGDRG